MYGSNKYQFIGTPVPTPMLNNAYTAAIQEKIEENCDDLAIWKHTKKAINK